MKIAIHHRSGSFSDKWIEYCLINNINYKQVNCYSTDIIEQLKDCDGLMWHWQHYDYKAKRFARQLLYSLEIQGKKVFPNFNTVWHFDDKVGQKYLLESIEAPLVKSYIFYDKKEALSWAEKVNYPKVFKLQGGAGSINVRLIINKNQARTVICKMFKKGILSIDKQELVKDRWDKLIINRNKETLVSFVKSIVLFIYPNLNLFYKYSGIEKGYIYFQNYIPNCKYDIRVIVIGNKAFAIKRLIRENGFKASGSGRIVYDRTHIPLQCLELAFNLTEKMNGQCIAFDFILSENQIYLLEVSYGFTSIYYKECPGYWDRDLNWHQGSFIPEWFIIENIVNSLRTG